MNYDEENKLIQTLNSTRHKDSDIVYEFHHKLKEPEQAWGQWDDISSLHMYSPRHNFSARIKEIIR